MARAYPRSRGATPFFRAPKRWYPGLSPLARGNPWGMYAMARSSGPIPARAGQPLALRVAWALQGAYPRSRGATEIAEEDITCQPGLSPLARGNPENWYL